MGKRAFFLFFTLLTLLVSGCQKYYLSICLEKIDRDYLSSTYVGSPDPRQENPPFGSQLIIEWQIPQEVLNKHPFIKLQVVYQDYEEAVFQYPISYKTGTVVNSLLGESFQQKKGFLSYKAEILLEDGSVFRQWEHQFWVQVILLEEESEQGVKEDMDSSESKEKLEEQAASSFFPETS